MSGARRMRAVGFNRGVFRCTRKRGWTGGAVQGGENREVEGEGGEGGVSR